MKKVALIAGVGGMCGGNMARMLHDTGEWDVIGVSRGDPELGDWVRYIPVDLLDREATLKALGDKSPTSMKVALRLLRAARASTSLQECLAREYRAALQVFDSAEFIEGVRATIIDKDRQPKWQPSRIEDVTPEIVDRYFAPHPGDRLVFPE